MSSVPENEKVIKLNQDDDDEEAWVDTHHGIGNQLFVERWISFTGWAGWLQLL